ncbi:hypothetical protein [Methylogaea oryzae]|uniref:Uncharacterized protein n=1 Tax=Methylogaea oryzae TaxID=1295382 RepID=A0A8D4VR05_9GAMM|nr:hypothetical protein [Methylogaea oryzae]BBL70810.1 hypothetical protein MoryE10_14160 [Methylogaea oryzae]
MTTQIPYCPGQTHVAATNCPPATVCPQPTTLCAPPAQQNAGTVYSAYTQCPTVPPVCAQTHWQCPTIPPACHVVGPTGVQHCTQYPAACGNTAWPGCQIGYTGWLGCTVVGPTGWQGCQPATSMPGCPSTSTCPPANAAAAAPAGGTMATVCTQFPPCAGPTGVQHCTQAPDVCGHTAWHGCPGTAATVCTQYPPCQGPAAFAAAPAQVGPTGTLGCTVPPQCVGPTGTQGCTAMPGCPSTSTCPPAQAAAPIGHTAWLGCTVVGPTGWQGCVPPTHLLGCTCLPMTVGPVIPTHNMPICPPINTCLPWTVGPVVTVAGAGC